MSFENTPRRLTLENRPRTRIVTAFGNSSWPHGSQQALWMPSAYYLRDQDYDGIVDKPTAHARFRRASWASRWRWGS